MIHWTNLWNIIAEVFSINVSSLRVIILVMSLCIPRTNVLPRIFFFPLPPCQFLSLSLSSLWWLKCQVTCVHHTRCITRTRALCVASSRNRSSLSLFTDWRTTNFVTTARCCCVARANYRACIRCTNALRNALTRIPGLVRVQSRGGNLLYIDRMQMEKIRMIKLRSSQ